MNLILSADQNWGIGCQNRLLFRVPGDMAFFRQMTTGKVVVMGRKTLESLPGGKPLPNRTNVVLTRDTGYRAEGVVAVHSREDLLEVLAPYHYGDIYVIGGEQIYRMLMPYCHRAYITKFDAVTSADAFVPNFDQLPGWRLSEESEPRTEKNITYRFCCYLQDSPKDFRAQGQSKPE